MRTGRALLVGYAAVFLVATCVLVVTTSGSSHATKPTLADLVREDIMYATHPRISCTRHACSMAYEDRIHDAHSEWLGARLDVWGVDDDDRLKSIRRLDLRIIDPHAHRVATIACVLHRYSLRPFPKGATSVSYPDDRKSCVEKLRPLA